MREPPGGPAVDAGPAAPPVSVAVVARDEEDRLPRTLASVGWARESVVVVDDRTRDRTAAVASESGARVEVREWTGYVAQKARALELCRSPWVLLLDADEVVSPALAREIADRLPEDGAGAGTSGRSGADGGAAGYEIPFHTRYLGRWLGRRGWHRERHLRLVRKARASVAGGPVHEGLRVEGRVGRLSNPVLHYSYRDPGHHADKIADYARLKAESLRARGRTASLPEAVLRAAASFVRGYLLRGRFLDGGAGLVWELMGGYYDLVTYAQLRELTRRPGGRGAAPDDAPDAAAGPPGTSGGEADEEAGPPGERGAPP